MESMEREEMKAETEEENKILIVLSRVSLKELISSKF